MTAAIQECYTHEKRIPSVTNLMTIAMAGMTKVFIGRIVAEGNAHYYKASAIYHYVSCSTGNYGKARRKWSYIAFLPP